MLAGKFLKARHWAAELRPGPPVAERLPEGSHGLESMEPGHPKPPRLDATPEPVSVFPDSRPKPKAQSALAWLHRDKLGAGRTGIHAQNGVG